MLTTPEAAAAPFSLNLEALGMSAAPHATIAFALATSLEAVGALRFLDTFKQFTLVFNFVFDCSFPLAPSALTLAWAINFLICVESFAKTLLATLPTCSLYAMRS
jgi:hypothetical protein